jgi:hypothetical protein
VDGTARVTVKDPESGLQLHQILNKEQEDHDCALAEQKAIFDSIRPLGF